MKGRAALFLGGGENILYKVKVKFAESFKERSK